MSLAISKVRDTVRTVTVTLLGDKLTVSYRVGVFGKELNAWIKDFGSDPGSLRIWIEKVISKWDLLTEENGPAVPITAQALEDMDVPPIILTAIRDAINDDLNSEKMRRA